MKKINLITEFDIYNNNSDLKIILSHQTLPLKYTIDDFDCYFYSPHLFGLFEMRVTKNGITPNDFAIDYKKGFEKGLKHLKRKEKISLSSFDNVNKKDNLIERLKMILHEREFEDGTKGLLKLVFDKVPRVFTEKNIYDRGYWNGIIYSIDALWIQAGLKEIDLKATSKVNSNNDFAEDAVNVFCKTMPLSIPKEHFKPLTIECSKDGKPFLTQEQFDNFINRAFFGKVDLPQQKFNQAPKGEKLSIQYVFRQFYDNYCFEYFNTGQKQDIFIKLLSDNFVGWNFDNVKANFKTKPKKTL